MTIQVITPLPTPVPSRLDPVNFATRADAFLASLPTFGDELNDFASEANALALEVQDNKNSVDATYVDMQELEVVMQGIYSNSVATGNFKGVWSSLTGALVKPATVFNAGSYWILLENLSDVTASEPTISNSDWLEFNPDALAVTYDPINSSLTATNVQDAIDEVYDYASSYLGNGSGVNVDDASKKTAREWLGIGSFGFKNKLINPTFILNQQLGEGVSVPVVAGSTIKYVVDQWYATCSGANITTQQVPSFRDNKYSLKITGANSNTGFMLGQRIEADNCYALKNKTMTVSLHAKSSSLRTTTWSVYYANTSDNFASKTLIANGTFETTTSAQKFTFNFNAGIYAGNGLAIELSGDALLVGATIEFDEVQLELSDIATEFETRSIQTETALCQRYWEKGLGQIKGAVSSSIGLAIQYTTTKRATPTMTRDVLAGSSIILAPAPVTPKDSVQLGGTSNETGFVAAYWYANARL